MFKIFIYWIQIINQHRIFSHNVLKIILQSKQCNFKTASVLQIYFMSNISKIGIFTYGEALYGICMITLKLKMFKSNQVKFMPL